MGNNSPQHYLGNPNLKAIGVDVSFTEEQVKEYIRCASDPKYFINNYVKVVSLDKGIVPFHLYPYQERIIDAVHNNRYTIGMLFRQSGKSTVMAAYMLWFATFNPLKNAFILANKMATAKEIFSRVQYMHELLPKWLQQGVKEWNKTSATFENGSKVRCAATSPSAIRGFSIDLLMLDEFAFLGRNLADEFIASVFPTLSSSEKSKLVLISTPNGKNHFYKIWAEAQEGTNGFAYVQGNWREIHNEKWYEEQSKQLGDPIRVAQELDCSFIGSSYTLVDGPVLNQIPHKKPIESTRGVNVFEPPQKGKSYVITVDVSRGRALDYSAFIVYDVSSTPFRVVCTFKDNTVSPQQLTMILHEYGTLYNEALMVIESNDLGESVASALWYEMEYGNMLFSDGRGEIKGHDRIGVRTTKSLKGKGQSKIKRLIEQHLVELNDLRIIQELEVYTLHSGGLYAAEDTSINDDLCTCLFLFGWLTDQSYFEGLTNINTFRQLTADFKDQIEDYVPFGFKTGGSDEYEPKEPPLDPDQISLLTPSRAI